MISPRARVLVAFAACCLAARPGIAADALGQCSPVAQDANLFSMNLESLLDAKVITASRSAEYQSDAPGVISVVSSDELRRFGGSTLREVLERVPGLTGTTAYFTDRRIVAARGDQTKIDGGHVLVLINGRPTREILEGGVLSDVFESFPVAALERVEVIRGPGSVLYGSNAFSSVINLITKENQRTGIAFQASGASSSAYSTGATGALTCGDLHIFGAAQLHRRPDWQTTYRIPASLLNDPFVPPVPLAQDITIRERGPGGFVDLRYKGFTLMTALSGYQNSSFVRGTVGKSDWGRVFSDAGFAFAPTPQWNAGVNLTLTKTTFESPSFPFISRRSHEMILEWNNSVRIGGATQVSFGTLYNHIDGSEVYNGVEPSIAISDGSRHSSALYGQMNHSINAHLSLIAGLQANKIGSLALDVVPRGGAIVHIGRRMHVKALYSKAFRAPSINETGLNHPGLVGDPDLRPEKVGTFDLAWTYHHRQLQANVGYFHSRQTDSIVVDATGSLWHYRNLGKATFRGGEADAKFYINPKVLVLGSVLYQTNEDGDGNIQVVPVSNLGAKAGISYQNKMLTASIFDSYQGALDGYAGGVNPAAGPYHMLGTHVRVDVSRYVGAGRGLAFFVNGENLTDREVWMPDWGSNSGDTLPTHRGRVLSFGFEVF